MARALKKVKVSSKTTANKKARVKKATIKKTTLKKTKLKKTSVKKVVAKKRAAKKTAAKTTAKKVTTKVKKVSKNSESESTRQSIETISSKMSKTKRKAANKLIVENREHGIRLAWNMLNKWRVRLYPEDVESVVGEALVESALRFDKDKGAQFKTFFFYHLRGMLLKEVAFMIKESKETFHIPSEVLENPAQATSNNVYVSGLLQNQQLVESKDPESLLIRKQFQKRFWDQCFALDDLEREIVERHFIQDEPLKSIAEDLNYCRCHISRVKSRTLKALKEFAPILLNENLSKEELEKLKESALSRRYTGGRGRRKITEKQKKDLVKA